MKNQNNGIAIVLLAAGDSRRFHGNKMLSEVDGMPMYQRMISKIKDIPAEQKIIVTQYEEIMNFISENRREYFIKAIKNEHSEWGISHSIHLGLEHCQDAEAYLFSVCDQPYLKKESIVKLIETYTQSEKQIACLSYQGKLGNPVVFHKSYWSQLQRLTGDSGGKSIVKQDMDNVELVEVQDPKELFDIDTRQEYDILQ